jgi:very-short-patch-repair endonuclease
MLDALLHAQLIGADDIAAIGACLGRRRRGRACRSRLALADGRSESPLETRLRLLLHDAGIPPETLQFVVRDAVGYPLARIDLAWPSRLLDVEADGAGPHSDPEALFRDRERQNELIGLGWTVLRFTWADVIHRPAYVVACVARHLRRL